MHTELVSVSVYGASLERISCRSDGLNRTAVGELMVDWGREGEREACR